MVLYRRVRNKFKWPWKWRWLYSEDLFHWDYENFASVGPENSDHSVLTYGIHIVSFDDETFYYNAHIEQTDRTQTQTDEK